MTEEETTAMPEEELFDPKAFWALMREGWWKIGDIEKEYGTKILDKVRKILRKLDDEYFEEIQGVDDRGNDMILPVKGIVLSRDWPTESLIGTQSGEVYAFSIAQKSGKLLFSKQGVGGQVLLWDIGERDYWHSLMMRHASAVCHTMDRLHEKLLEVQKTNQ